MIFILRDESGINGAIEQGGVKQLGDFDGTTRRP
jgi:hypothetical protein